MDGCHDDKQLGGRCDTDKTAAESTAQQKRKKQNRNRTALLETVLLLIVPIAQEA